MTEGVVVLIAALVVAGAFALWRRRTDGRLRTERVDASHPPQHFTVAELGAPLGSRATLVQFSTAFCQPCVGTRRILGEISTMVDGVTHIEIDAEAHLELVRRFHVHRTPTVFVLDANGQVIRRASGAPRKADVLAALGVAIPTNEPPIR